MVCTVGPSQSGFHNVPWLMPEILLPHLLSVIRFFPASASCLCLFPLPSVILLSPPLLTAPSVFLSSTLTFLHFLDMALLHRHIFSVFFSVTFLASHSDPNTLAYTLLSRVLSPTVGVMFSRRRRPADLLRHPG